MHDILLVEDDVELASLASEFLRNHGYRVDELRRGDPAPARILETSRTPCCST